MATIRVDVIGDSTSLKRALAEAGGAANTAGGHFTSLAKTMVGLGAAFLGASSILEGFKKSVDAAEALNAATRQLDAQLRANGESVKAVTPFVAQLNSEFEKLGFTSADTEAAFTRLDRASGSAALAYKEMGVAADLARAKNISFQQAALLIGKVIDGNTAALNRYGIAIPKGTSAIDALAIAHQKLAGQAAAAATPMKVFSATVTDVAAKIGNELLPVIDKYLGQLDKWLSKSSNQEKITNAVGKAVQFFETAIAAASGVIQALIGPTEAVVNALGGLKNTLEDLIALKLAFTVASWGSALGAFGKSAGAAKAEATGLRAAIGGLANINPIVIPVSLAVAVDALGLNPLRGQNIKSPTDIVGILTGRKGLLYNLLAGGGGSTPDITSGGAALSSLTSGSAMKQFIAKEAAALGLDPKAVLGVATAEGGFGGAIGDGGHAFGPFQLNNAGGVLTGFQGNPQQYANSAAGILYALKEMAKVAGGLKGMAAISAIVGRFERPKDPTHDLETAGAYYFGSGSGQSEAGIQNGLPPGSLTPPDLSGGGGSSKPKAAPAYKLPQALEASIRKAQDDFKNNVTAAHLATLKSLLTQEESLLKAHGQDAKAASVANEITDAMKKLEDSFLTAAKNDATAAAKAGASAIAAFAKGQDGPAAKYIKAEVADLKAEKAQLEKALAAAPQADKAAIQTQIEAVTKQLAGLKGVAAWIESVAKIIGNFSAKLKTEGAKYTELLTQQTAASELQAVGYFADTADTLTAINKSIVSSLEAEKTTLTQEQDALKAKLASAPANLKAGLQAQITAIGGKITSLTSSISSAMGTVEQDLASAVTQAQQQFQTAVANLQTDLDNQIQANAMNASGATGDAATLAGMQAADQLKGLTDALSAAQSQLSSDSAASPDLTAAQNAVNAAQAKVDADKKASASAAQLTIDQNTLSKATAALKDILNSTAGSQVASDQAAVAAAQRAIDEYNLSNKAQAEATAATATATDQTNKFNSALGDLEGQLLSGKITTAQFESGLADLGKQFGVNIDTTGAQFIAVASAAAGVVGAFNSLISWINSQTGSNISPVGGGGTSSVTNAPGPPDSPNRGGTNATGIGTVGTPQNLGVVGAGAAGYTGNIHTPGLQFAMGGIVPGNLGQPQFAIVHGGELVVPVGGFGGQSQRSIAASSRGGGGDIHIHVAGSVVAEKELMQLIRTQSARSSLRGTTVFGPT